MCGIYAAAPALKQKPIMTFGTKALDYPRIEDTYHALAIKASRLGLPAKLTAIMRVSEVLRRSSQSRAAWKVSQLATCPDLSPVMNQRVRCSDEPWVKASGTTYP